MHKRISIKLALVVFSAGLCFSAHAQVSTPPTTTTTASKSKTAKIEVSATVESNCEITANPLAFGKYDPLSKTDTLATSAITLTCVKNTSVTGVELDGIVTGTTRQMKDGTKTLDYQVFKAGNTAGAICDANSWSVWGKGSDALTPGIAADASTKNYNLCGLIKAGQDVDAGEYKDTLTAEVKY